MLMLRRIFPQSLIGRVFALYSATLLLFVGGSLSLFYQYQYNEAVEDAQRSATMLIEVAAQTVSDSAVIGDYDTIARTLDKAILRSQFASAVFIDLTGGRVESGNADLRKTSAPDWLQQRIATQLYDVNRTISVGGTDYGVLRLAFASENVAESLWQLLRTALGLAFASLAGGLLLIWLSLKRWLGTLDRVHTFEREALNSGSADKADPIDDVPLEFRPAFEILQRTTDSLRRELLGREQALKSLREIVASLLPASELPAEDDGDIAVLSKVIATMVAEREASRQALEEAKNAAEAANLAKSRFLATMSHEIRTPMNGILGMAQMLLMTEVDDADRRDYARTILGSGQTLLTLLNDILDLSKIEAGKVELETASFAPASLVDDVMSLFAEPARAKNLQLTANWSGMAQQCYQGDAHRLRQMLSNLIGNAIKFSSRGNVCLEAREIAHDGNSAQLEFSVADTGIGIAAEKLAVLFKPFSQADSSTTREFGGSGLGLSIVRSLAHLMGGEVGVESEQGKGSRFWFTIRVGLEPLSAPAQLPEFAMRDASSGESAIALDKGTILVVEDNATNRKVVTTLLGRLGLDVETAENGQQAVDAIRSGLRPNLVLMDIQMPVMDGRTATRRIREWESDNNLPRLPIAALTADAFEEDRQLCMAAGMDDFLTKPVALDALRALVARNLSGADKHRHS